MAKRRKKQKKKAALPPPPPPVEEPVPGPELEKKEPRPEKEWRRYGPCGVCSRKRQAIAYTDGDAEWEFSGHPDHFMRDVCVKCLSDMSQFDEVCVLVYAAMRKKLEKQGLSRGDVEHAVHTARRSFNVDFDRKFLVKVARSLKVKHQWLKGKRVK